MMAQYLEIKSAYPDCLLFYRMGDFYELFFEDAEVASRVLSIALTKRGKHQGNDIPMCGVPVDRADDYLLRLIAAEQRVAVCEQVEDPAEAKKRGPKSVVRREVIRLVTPGTITEERLLEPGQANLFLTIARRKQADESWMYGLAAVDISTGRFVLAESDQANLAAAIARLEPREIVLPEQIYYDEELLGFWREIRTSVTPLAGSGFESSSAEQRLRDYYNVASLDAFGSFSRPEIAAAGIALFYIEKTQFDDKPVLLPPIAEANGTTLSIDAATRANLELTRTLSGERNGSLLATIDRTQTPGGTRLLAEWLAGPLMEPTRIHRRQDAVAFFVENTPLRDNIRAVLKKIPDISRALSRLGLGRSGPRDLAALRDGLFAARELSGLLDRQQGELPQALTSIIRTITSLDTSVADELAALLDDELPLLKRDGGFIRPGAIPELDETRELQQDSRRFIASLQAQYATELDCRTLRIKHNNMLGYYIEVPQNVGQEMFQNQREKYVHRQTMSDAMRFTTVELGELEAKIASASDRALRIELGIFDRLCNTIVGQSRDIAATAAALAAADVFAGLAELAVELAWVRPHVDESLAFHIEGGRHPVVEAALRRDGKSFIANGCDLSSPETSSNPGGQILLITGPNMGGKSTYLRQNALIAILAQMGAFVPATEARIGIVDRLFSRVGAADDLARGRSTFMVEMVETAAILNQATARSLVILDEIGRGTSTFDGLSIAWAAIENLHEINRCRSLFATHFHELTVLSEKLSRLENATLKVTEWKGEVVFLHEVTSGAADRSYGLQVARLAGLPTAVINRAKVILAELERSDREQPKRAIIDDLPLFAMAQAQTRVPEVTEIPEPKDDPLRKALEDIDPDSMTPREALEALYLLKNKAQ
ncbi:DNA mismatch repair protein MutS [Microvirga sp. W0021]|uniref:DNA mismatch repair protein MutS n=2 Tax=Hohaiivirga grylli TaxID=3133970 RepID=A0ABV0BFL0_9HYPH